MKPSIICPMLLTLVLIASCATYDDANSRAKKICESKKAGKVYLCEDNITIVSPLAGPDYKYYAEDGKEIICQTENPSLMSEECKKVYESKVFCDEVC